MSEKNQYCIKAFLEGLQEVEVGTRIGDCEFGFDKISKQHFLSTIVSAENKEEAPHKGRLRLNQLLSVVTVHTGTPYNINWIGGNQISGMQPFQSVASRSFTIEPYFPASKDKIEEVGKLIEFIDRLPKQERSTMRVDKAISYFQRGCYLETKWRSESFLNFYKVVELISHDFKKHFDIEVSNQMKNTLLKDLTKEELKDMRTPKRLIQFICEQLGITDCNISEIVKLRNEFSAHARLKEVTVSKEDFSNCKALAGKLVINYVNYISLKSNSPTG